MKGRYHMPRQFYVPKESAGAVNIERKAFADGSEVYTYEAQGVLYAIAFAGKQAKPTWHFRFRDVERRAKKIAEFVDGREYHAKAMAERKVARTKPHSLKVGDILESSWGYDQTNIDHYEVTRVPGPNTVEIRKLAQGSGPEDGFMTAECWPLPGKYVGEPMIKRVSAYGGVKIASYAHAFPWKGGKSRYSWYA